MTCQGRQRGQVVVIVSASPSSPATDRKAETWGGGPSILVSVAVMMAGGDDGLPLRWVGSQVIMDSAATGLTIGAGTIVLETGRSVLLRDGDHTNTNSADATASPPRCTMP